MENLAASANPKQPGKHREVRVACEFAYLTTQRNERMRSKERSPRRFAQTAGKSVASTAVARK